MFLNIYLFLFTQRPFSAFATSVQRRESVFSPRRVQVFRIFVCRHYRAPYLFSLDLSINTSRIGLSFTRHTLPTNSGLLALRRFCTCDQLIMPLFSDSVFSVCP